MDAIVVDRYHQDLAAAITARVPIDLGDVVSGASKSSIRGRIDGRKLDRLQHWDGPADQLPIAYRAGLQMYRDAVPADLILDGLSWRDQARGQVSRIIARSIWYILVVALVAVAGLAFHQIYVTPTFDAFLIDLELDGIDRESMGWPGLQWLQRVAVGIAVAVMMAMIVVAHIGPAQVLGWLGGHRFEHDRATAIATRAVAAQLAVGVEPAAAIDRSIGLVGGCEVAHGRLTQVVDSSDDVTELDNRLNLMAHHYDATATDRLAVINSMIPTLMLTLVGGLIAIAYGLAVFYPLVLVLRQLGQQV